LTPFGSVVKRQVPAPGGLLSQPSERATSRTGEETYDAIVARLERVVGELESGQLTLEQSIERFAEGVRLARDASRKLDEAERRVEQLVRSADGGDEAVPLETDAGKGS
jgi:exodeoxyribonuclease VII small subunit